MMMTTKIFSVFDNHQLAHAPVRELHNGGWTDFQETPDRAKSISKAIGTTVAAKDWGLEPITAVHDAEYIAFLQTAYSDWKSAGRDGDAIGYVWPVVGRRRLNLSRIDARLGRFSYDAGTPIAQNSWQSAYWSAQTALTALDGLLSGQHKAAFALCRPPGHHAGADYMGGYCYLNNAAIAAREAQRRGAVRVAILDIDYHHGNGTQDIFYDDADIFFASIHADPATDYPFYWGHADERGAGAGEGATLNIPLPRGTDIGGYNPALKTALSAIAGRKAECLIISFGADIYSGDPISFFKLEREDFRDIGQKIAALNLPTLIVMEGGYATDDLGRNVAAFLAAFSP
jgi:acetoin utilization deacetylase AcuC-like enzyme